jgi:hypothetical protein
MPATNGYAPRGNAAARALNNPPDASATAPAPPAASKSRREMRVDIDPLSTFDYPLKVRDEGGSAVAIP